MLTSHSIQLGDCQARMPQDVPLDVAVSKLCCPVCWDFFEIIKDDSDMVQFTVRGHHTVLYLQHLPSWLPDNVVKRMVVKYGSYLLDELRQMMLKKEQEELESKSRDGDLNKRLSIESEGGLSMSSDSSHEDERSILKGTEEAVIRTSGPSA